MYILYMSAGCITQYDTKQCKFYSQFEIPVQLRIPVIHNIADINPRQIKALLEMRFTSCGGAETCSLIASSETSQFMLAMFSSDGDENLM